MISAALTFTNVEAKAAPDKVRSPCVEAFSALRSATVTAVVASKLPLKPLIPFNASIKIAVVAAAAPVKF